MSRSTIILSNFNIWNCELISSWGIKYLDYIRNIFGGKITTGSQTNFQVHVIGVVSNTYLKINYPANIYHLVVEHGAK